MVQNAARHQQNINNTSKGKALLNPKGKFKAKKIYKLNLKEKKAYTYIKGRV